MLDNGVHLPPSQYEAWFVGLAHTDKHIDQTIAAAERAGDPALGDSGDRSFGGGRFD
jgi:glutamate-1-semialdehyde 2,1-aminomutase